MTWLWGQVAAAANRRGDRDLTTGTLSIAAAGAAAERAAAAGLLGGQPLRAGQQRTVVLADLTRKLRIRGTNLTPGAVAAHATGRPLAIRAQDKARREAILTGLQAQLLQMQQRLPAHAQTRMGDDVWAHLRQSGWLARLVKETDPHTLLADACAVLAALPDPGERADRRTLVPGRPHALDDGTPLAGLVFALTRVGGRRPRHAWDALGVDIDNLTGGLLSLGIQPEGWHLPQAAVVTLPPRELVDVQWPTATEPDLWVFVTENPSVMAAAADLVRHARTPVRLLCTAGTPSAVENAAIGRLAAAGWNVTVRADFDAAGLAHVRALLAAAPTATPWRMSAADYRNSAAQDAVISDVAVDDAATPWAPTLAAAMTASGAAAYEEDLLPDLLKDLRAGRPPSWPTA